METKLRENQSSIKEILNLLAPGRASNPPCDVTLVPDLPIGGADN